MNTATRCPEPNASCRVDNILAALRRGELVRILADLDAGKISLAEFEAARERYERRGWLLRALAAVLGR